MAQKVRVLIVDDSAFVRLVLTRKLGADPDIEIVGIARDGVEALEQIKALRPDVVTMDVEMPRADGLTALRNIMTTAPTPVVMLSTLTTAGAATTLKALELGAVDFYPKPTVADTSKMEAAAGELQTKIKAAARARVPGRRAPAATTATPFRSAPVKADGPRTPALLRPPLETQRVVAIATSTGGPKALVELVPRIPKSLKAAYVIVQHMPPHFTRTLAERLDGLSELTVREGKAGDTLQRGVALLAPGGYHMRVNEKGVIELDESPPIHGVRPAADMTMSDVARVYGDATLGVVLTGMGVDGTDGAAAIKRQGGLVIAEHENSCTVYGMPRSVIEAGLADRVTPLSRVSNAIAEVFGAAAAA